MAYRELGEPALEYIITWIQQFVLSKCERGRGTRPRLGWSYKQYVGLGEVHELFVSFFLPFSVFVPSFALSKFLKFHNFLPFS